MFVPIFVGIFLFIWILNEFGVLFIKALGLPFGGSPTSDLNTTAAFALCVFFGIQFLAIRKSGIRAYAHLFKPYFFLFPINLIEEVARPVVLAMRLAFNILAGELLLFVIATIIVSNVSVQAICPVPGVERSFSERCTWTRTSEHARSAVAGSFSSMCAWNVSYIIRMRGCPTARTSSARSAALFVRYISKRFRYSTTIVTSRLAAAGPVAATTAAKSHSSCHR